jgi:hypothetical protein
MCLRFFAEDQSLRYEKKVRSRSIKKVNRILYIFIFAFMCLVGTEAKTNTCSFVVVGKSEAQLFPINEGRQIFVFPHFVSRLFKGIIRVLGEGGYGGTVYRLIPIDGKPQVLKRGVDKEELQEDQNTMDWLRRFNSYKGSPVRISRSKILPEDPRTMRLENLYGTNLDKVMRGPWLSPFLKNRLRVKYEEFLADVIKTFKSEYPSQSISQWRYESFDDGLPAFQVPAFDKMSRKPKRLFIKADNILVDPYTLELTLIDPH